MNININYIGVISIKIVARYQTIMMNGTVGWAVTVRLYDIVLCYLPKDQSCVFQNFVLKNK